jgi:hypothetical protein
MMRESVNRFLNPWIIPNDWNMAPHGPISLDDLMTTRDIIPVVRRLYGDVEADNITYLLPRHWARNNKEEADMFFTEERVQEEHRSTLGY